MISLALLCMTGCSLKQETQQENTRSIEMPSSSSSSDTEKEKETTQPTTVFDSMPDLTGIRPADGTFIFDDAGILSEKDLSDCNDFAGLLYEDHLINTAVLTVDDLHDMTPHEYAEKAFDDIYGSMGSAMILIINNDTDQDYLYRTGSCSRFISDADENNAFFWATKDIVTDDYRSGILRLLGLGSECPEHIFDNAMIFSDEECAELEDILSGKNTNIAVLATTNSTERTNEEICQDYCDRRFKDTEGIMIMLDKKTMTFTALPEDSVPAELKTALSDAVLRDGKEFDTLCSILEDVK